MLDIKFVRANPEAVRQGLANRGMTAGLDAFLTLEERRRQILTAVEAIKARRNEGSAEVAKLKRQGGDAAELIESLAAMRLEVENLDEQLKEVEGQVRDWLLATPNLPHASVPVGANENDNPVMRVVGTPRTFDFPPQEHQDIGERLSGIDLARAAKLSGARFAVLRGPLAKLERALVAFMLDMHLTEHGYTEIAPPYIVTADSLFATGQLPKFAAELFKLDGLNSYLIPTAEVPVTNLHRAETLAEADLPVAYAAFTPCFRSEAGSYGKDTKGLIRLHQFDKVELVRFVHPDASYDELERLTGHAAAVLERLALPYRVVSLCTGDLGFSAAKTYDLEVWLPGQGKYREISSCSNFEDFQARRGDIKFKPAGSKKTALVHTLNGSGLAVGRTMAAVLENGVQKDGSVVLPGALVPYMGGVEVLEPR